MMLDAYGMRIRGNGIAKCGVNNRGIINLPVRNIYYYINGMGWDNCCLTPSLLGFYGEGGEGGKSDETFILLEWHF